MFCGYEMAYWFSKFLLLKRWLSLNAFIKYFFLVPSCFHLLHGYRCGLNVLFPTDLFSGLHLRNTGFVRKLPNSRLLLYVCVEQQCAGMQDSGTVASTVTVCFQLYLLSCATIPVRCPVLPWYWLSLAHWVKRRWFLLDMSCVRSVLHFSQNTILLLHCMFNHHYWVFIGYVM
jgi:hypothetical protein